MVHKNKRFRFLLMIRHGSKHSSAGYCAQQVVQFFKCACPTTYTRMLAFFFVKKKLLQQRFLPLKLVEWSVAGMSGIDRGAIRGFD